MVKYLVAEQWMDPLCEDEYGHIPMHRACAGGSLAVVEFLTSELIPIAQLMSDHNNILTAHLFTMLLQMVLGHTQILHL